MNNREGKEKVTRINLVKTPIEPQGIVNTSQ
jgi:hypothetical protein